MKELFLKRQSCRNYKVQKVGEKLLNELIETASLAPSARNTQPWKLYAVTKDQVVIDGVREGVQPDGANKFADNVNDFIVIVEQKPWYLLDEKERGKHSDFVATDIGIFTAHLVLTAEKMGLSTCILGRMNKEVVKKAIGLTGEEVVSLVIAVGYKQDDDILRVKTRKQGKDLVEYL
ncbi:MAG: nitroreductase family protein [Clostridia bacterium]|nr:nitroreductase family protein [Clostridia bacterium]MBR2614814.1 nitroreductase family protein [Clostridia bacterium]